MLALHALHGLGIIHRDVKPENVFIDALGHVVLGDFGLSKQFEMVPSEVRHETNPFWSASNRKPLTFGTQTVCGTPVYCAPEIFLGLTYSFEIDLWAVGVIF